MTPQVESTYGYQQVPGMNCPGCRAFIPFSIRQLLSGPIECPACGLRLEIDAEPSRKAVQVLEELDQKLRKNTSATGF